MSAVESDRHNMLSAIAANEQRITSEGNFREFSFIQKIHVSKTMNWHCLTRQIQNYKFGSIWIIIVFVSTILSNDADLQ